MLLYFILLLIVNAFFIVWFYFAKLFFIVLLPLLKAFLPKINKQFLPSEIGLLLKFEIRIRFSWFSKKWFNELQIETRCENFDVGWRCIQKKQFSFRWNFRFLSGFQMLPSSDKLFRKKSFSENLIFILPQNAFRHLKRIWRILFYRHLDLIAIIFILTRFLTEKSILRLLAGFVWRARPHFFFPRRFFFLVRRHLRRDIFNGKWTRQRRLLKQKVLIIKNGTSKLILTF